MAHVITHLCLRDGACVDVCPVECIIAGKPDTADGRMDGCIDIDPTTLRLPKNARTFALKPTDGFKPEHSYLISVNPGIFSAIKAKPIVSQFTVSTKEDCGAISGKCIADGEWVVVEAKKEGSTSPFSTIVKRDQKGTFKYTFTELPPGNYSISAFIPSGKNKPAQDRQWNPGSIDTGQPAEPFGSLPERVMVRAQWTTNIADIHIMTSR